jgi:hypothetical protein
MDPWLTALLREQQDNGFADIAGAEAALTLPLSDRLITRLVTARLPPNAAISEVDVRAEPGNHFKVRVRLTRPAFLPPIGLRFAIERQPELPGSPVLVLRLIKEGLGAFAGSALRVFDVLPRGITFDGDRFSINLATLLEPYGAADTLRYVTALALTTDAGRVIINARATATPP